jgi:hypothetical protein
MTEADRRALTPLFWTHVNLYGRFDLNMDTHLDLDQALAAVAARAIPTQRAPATGGVTTTTSAGGDDAG